MTNRTVAEHERILTVSNEEVAEYIIGMSFERKRRLWEDWKHAGWRDAGTTFREFAFAVVENTILNNRDATYNEAGEPL